MNKGELVAAVADKINLSRGQAGEAIDAAIEVITGALKKGDDVKIVGFGTFVVTNRAAGEARNPRTGEKVKVPASKTPKFRAGAGLKDDDQQQVTRFSQAFGDQKADGACVVGLLFLCEALTHRTSPHRDGHSGTAPRSASGRLAQLVEHLVYTERVGGSSPSPPTNHYLNLVVSAGRRGLGSSAGNCQYLPCISRM